MGWLHSLSRVPISLIVAASAWSPIAPFRPKPVELPCLDSGILGFMNTCIIQGDPPPLPFVRTTGVTEQPEQPQVT